MFSLFCLELSLFAVVYDEIICYCFEVKATFKIVKFNTFQFYFSLKIAKLNIREINSE